MALFRYQSLTDQGNQGNSEQLYAAIGCAISKSRYLDMHIRQDTACFQANG